MAKVEGEPCLLTPGPLTTSFTVKQAMLRDWGSRDRDFVALNARLRERLLRIAGAERTHVCVPLQGSGTFVVEAMLGTLVPPGRAPAGAGEWRVWRAHGQDGAPPRPPCGCADRA